jgi:autotransporter-associated beta strand protein
VVLTGDNANWSGNILVNGGGTLTASSVASLGTGSAEVDGGVLGIRNTSFSSATVNTSLTLNAGTVAYSRSFGALTQEAGITIMNSGAITQASMGNTITFAGDIAGSGTLTFNGLDITSSAANDFSGLLSVNATLTLSSGASFTHVTETDVNVGGALRVTSPAGAIEGVNSVQLHSVVLKSGALALAGDVDPSAFLSASSTGGAIGVDVSNATFGGTNVLDFSALPAGASMGLGTMNGGSIAATVDIRPDASNTLRLVGLSHNGNQLTINAPLTDHGAALSVDVASGAFIILAGNSTYSGQTTVEGALTVAGNNALGAGTGSGADGTVLNGGSLTIRSGVTIADEKITLTNGGFINNSGILGGPIVFDTSGTLAGNGTFSGPISGAANFLLSGSITLSGDNTYTGTATINSGNVTVLSSLPNANVNGGTLTLSGPEAGVITLTSGEVDVNAATSGAFAVSGGTLNMNAAGSGDVSLTGGSMVLRDAVHPYANAISVANTTLVAISSTSAIVDSRPLQTQGSVTLAGGGSAPFAVDFAGGLAGSGVLHLAAGNGSGGVNGGISASGGISFNGALYTSGQVSAGTLQDTGWLKVAFGSLTLSGALTQTGDLYVTGPATLNGDATISGTVWENSASFTVNGDVSANRWVLDGGGLGGNGGVHSASRTLELVGLSNSIDFTGTLDVDSIDEAPSASVQILALPTAFAGQVNIHGTATMESGAASSAATIQVSPGGAFLQLGSGTFANTIHLLNADGAGNGALVGLSGGATLTTALDVGSIGSSVGGTLTLSGGVTGGGTLTVYGVVTLNAPTSNAGDTIVDAGRLTLQSTASLGSSGSLVVRNGGEVDLAALASGNRVGPAKAVVLQGGSFRVNGDPDGQNSTAESVGIVSAERGANFLDVLTTDFASPAAVTSLTIAGLQRSTGATVSFGGGSSSSPLGADAHPARLFINGQAATDFLGGAYTDGYNTFVRYDAGRGVVPFADADYWTGAEATWDATKDVWLGSSPATQDATLTQSRTIRSLRLESVDFPPVLNLGSNTLNIISGGIAGYETIATINGGAGSHLTAGGDAAFAELFLTMNGAVSANITDNPGADGLYDAAPGGPLDNDNGRVALVISNATVTLSGVNSYTGGTYINNSEVKVESAASVPTGADLIVTGGSYGIDGPFTAALGAVTIHSGGIGGAGSLQAASITIESGSIVDVKLLGNTAITKTSSGMASLDADLSSFTGAIAVNGGILNIGANVQGPLQIGSASVFFNGTLSGPLSLGESATLSISGGTTTCAGASISPSSRVIVTGQVILTGAADPFTDSVDASHHANVENNGSLFITQGNKSFGTLTGAGSLEVDAGASLSVQKVSLVGDSADVMGRLTLRPDGGTSDALGFVLGSGSGPTIGVVDITNNRLVVRLPGGTPLAPTVATLQAWVASARNGGAWNGPGITSSTAAADGPGATIAVVDNGQLGLTMFGDAPVDDRSILLMETFIGDANLDHAVTVADLARLAPFFGTTTTGGWADGDFNGDGVVNAADIEMLEPFYGLGTTGPIPSFVDALASVGLAGVVPTPEPASLLLLGVPMLLLTRRRVR